MSKSRTSSQKNKDEKSIEKISEEQEIFEIPSILIDPDEEPSPVAKELERFKKEVEQIQDAIESINLRNIKDPDEKIKATTAKMKMMLMLPKLISDLEDLYNKNKLKSGDIKGQKSVSPIESGDLDDEDD